ncbi:hypothetical protein NP493_236g02019 [Ridgeia piscesae]|uniref:2'-deoxynucleoside 5'-phosphate N-hydrolase 1 n=1 Tax=Ridgeia piscesae TaxID=27915 RepID=A0AAD9NZU8_RIDPI|nr:hypothetical protein NP493_236g02019 [Ridgeia piscesae]
MTLKIYFCGSIRGGREDAQLYAKIISHLKSFGTVLTEHVGWDDVLESERDLDAAAIYNRDLNWLKETDVVQKNCYIFSVLSEMIDGIHNGESFTVKHYDEKHVMDIITKFMSSFPDVINGLRVKVEEHVISRSVRMTLKIYFCGSIRGGREDAQLYAKIISHLKSFGTVLTEHVGRADVMESVLSCIIEGAHDGENFTVVHYEESKVLDIVTKFMSSFSDVS